MSPTVKGAALIALGVAFLVCEAFALRMMYFVVTYILKL